MWLSHVIEKLVDIYKKRIPKEMLSNFLPTIGLALARCMCSRYYNFQSMIWIRASEAFSQILMVGVPAFNSKVKHSTDVAIDDATWLVLASCFEAFLLGKHFKLENNIDKRMDLVPLEPDVNLLTPTSLTEMCRHDAEVSLSMLDTLADVLLTNCDNVSDKYITRLIKIIDEGIIRQRPTDSMLSSGERFSHACLRKMYVLCSRGEDSNTFYFLNKNYS